MFDVIARYKLLLEIVLIGSLALGAMWGVHQFLEHERDIGRAEVRAQWDDQIVKDKQAALEKKAEWDKQRETATIEGVKRDETISNLGRTVAVVSSSLRDAISKTNGGLSGDSIDTLRERARTYGELLAGCQGRYEGMGEKAERLNSDKKTLMDAWPK